MSSTESNSHQNHQPQSYQNWLTVGMFLAAINIPLLATIFSIDPTPNYDRLAPAPTMPRNLREVTQLPGNFTAYYSDHFGFRRSLTQLHSDLISKVFQISPSNRVQLGNNDWLFLKSENTLDDWRSLYPFDEQQLTDWQTMLEKRHQFLAERGIPYIFVIAPNKHTIYGDQLPNHLQRTDNPSRLDQLIARLQATNSPVQILDLRPALKTVSQSQRTYHYTDTHWNLLGAYVGYSEIAQQLNELAIPVTIPDLESITLTEETVLGGDLARMMGQKRQLTEPRITVDSFDSCKITQADGTALKVEDIDIPGDAGNTTLCPTAPDQKLLMFHDSFGKLLYPYLASQFQNSVFVWSDDFDPKIVEQEKPDIVIQQLVERRLFNRQPNLEEFSAPTQPDS